MDNTLTNVTRLFDGLYVVYMGCERLFHGFNSDDVPPEYAGYKVNRIYPFNDSVIIEISAESANK